MFRNLRADEIDCRVGTVTERGVSLLLYKDARVDQSILDESGKHWQRKHYEVKGNLFCEVSIWNEDIKQWIGKSDCGTESNTEKEKGEASDSFKRACFNWGIGRELYTAPFIFTSEPTTKKTSGKGYDMEDKYAKFKVNEITIDEKKEITSLKITKNGIVVYDMKNSTKTKKVDEPPQVNLDKEQKNAEILALITAYRKNEQKKSKNKTTILMAFISGTAYENKLNDLKGYAKKMYAAEDIESLSDEQFDELLFKTNKNVKKVGGHD